MADDNPLAEGALSRDPDKAHADAYKRRLAQKRAYNAHYYERKHSKRAFKDADDKGELQSLRDGMLKLRESLCSFQSEVRPEDRDRLEKGLVQADAQIARIDAAIGRVDARVAARADKIARALADAEESELGPPLGETPGTTPQPSPADPKHLNSPAADIPYWHPEAGS
jgi:hypothetical protein